MKKTHFLLSLSLFLLSFAFLPNAFGQQYAQVGSGGVGLRIGGLSSGISAKYFFRDDLAVEGILGTSFGRRGFQFTALFEQHMPITKIEGLYWFFGGGGHVGAYKGRYYYDRSNKHFQKSYDKTLATVGIDGIIGLDYKIAELPLSVGVDFKPFLDANQDGFFLYGDGALTIRYTF